VKNILICYNCGFGGAKYEDFADEFRNNGHNVLLVKIGKLALEGQEEMRQIISFEPDLAFSFNNVIPKFLLDNLRCPVAVIDADSPLDPTFINRENLNHPNIYYFGYQSVSDEIYKKIPNFTLNREKYLYLSFTATNFKSNNQLGVKIPVAFLGSNVMSYHYDRSQNYRHGEVIALVKGNKSWNSDCEKYNYIKHVFNAQKRLKYLSQLADVGLQIYGNSTWEDVFKNDIDLAMCYVEKIIVHPKSVEDLYNRSKISINIDHEQAETSFSFRVPDIMASNACVLTGYKKDWEDLFGKYISQEVKDAIIYMDQHDMRKKCINLLNDEELRLRCVQECQWAIEQNGRWKHRLKKIEDFLNIKLLNVGLKNGTINYLKIDNSLKITQPKKSSEIGVFKRFYYGFFIFLYNVVPLQKISFFQQKNIKYLNKLLSCKTKTKSQRSASYYPIRFLCWFTPSKTMRFKLRCLYSQSLSQPIIPLIKKNIFYSKRFGNKKLPIKVVFLVHLPSSWDVFDSIYRECLADELFDAYIVTVPRRQLSQYSDFRHNDENYNFFHQKGISVIKGYDKEKDVYFDLKSFKPDIVFVQTPYDCQRPEIYAIDNLNKFTRVCYLQYAFIITSGSFEPSFYNTKFHKNCWRLFAETYYHKDLYIKYNGADISSKVIVSGYPKFDAYRKGLGDKDLLWNISKSVNPKIKRLIWCPHWTMSRLFDSSNFLQYYKYFLNLAKNNENIDLVIRPHPLLFDELLTKNYLSQSELGGYLRKVDELPNAKIDDNMDYFDLFRTSDMLISDNSSFLAEYLPVNNPIIYTNHYENNSVNLNDYGVILTKYHYIAKNEDELDKLINKVLLQGCDYNGEKRIANTKQHMSFIDNNSGLFIKNYLKKSFGF